VILFFFLGWIEIFELAQKKNSGYLRDHATENNCSVNENMSSKLLRIYSVVGKLFFPLVTQSKGGVG